MGSTTIEETVVQDAVIESKMQLVETIAKMAEGIMRIHGVILPRDDKAKLTNSMINFISDSEAIGQQIENQIRIAINRPPAA